MQERSPIQYDALDITQVREWVPYENVRVGIIKTVSILQGYIEWV